MFLDIPHDDIIARCEEMKVDRVIGQATKSLQEILKDRSDVYEQGYDLRVLVERGATVEQIADLVIGQLYKDQRFFSTRDTRVNREPTFFFDTIIKGLAKDRGLYFPEYVPSISLKQLERLVDLPYQER